MARDIFAIPATSVSVERVFSISRQICTDLRSSLKAETIKEALLTKVWIKGHLIELVPKPRPVAKHGSAELLGR
jgi:hAT family C-terminal dimerisation region